MQLALAMRCPIAVASRFRIQLFQAWNLTGSPALGEEKSVQPLMSNVCLRERKVLDVGVQRFWVLWTVAGPEETSASGKLFAVQPCEFWTEGFASQQIAPQKRQVFVRLPWLTSQVRPHGQQRPIGTTVAGLHGSTLRTALQAQSESDSHVPCTVPHLQSLHSLPHCP